MKYLYVFVLLLFMGCTSLQPEPQLDSSSSYYHKITKAEFPIINGEFVRTRINEFNHNATDVGVTYHHSKLPIVITVYNYPVVMDEITQATSDIEEEYNGAKDAILIYMKGSSLIADGDYSTNNDATEWSGYRAVFVTEDYYQSDNGTKSRGMTELYLFRAGDYFYKFRMTYPAMLDANRIVEDFIKNTDMK